MGLRLESEDDMVRYGNRSVVSIFRGSISVSVNFGCVLEVDAVRNGESFTFENCSPAEVYYSSNEREYETWTECLTTHEAFK